MTRPTSMCPERPANWLTNWAPPITVATSIPGSPEDPPQARKIPRQPRRSTAGHPADPRRDPRNDRPRLARSADHRRLDRGHRPHVAAARQDADPAAAARMGPDPDVPARRDQPLRRPRTRL